MSKYWKLKETGANCKVVFVSTDNSVQNILRKIKKASKMILRIFWSLEPKFISAGETRH